MIESFDGTSLLDQESGTDEAPLRNPRNLEDGLDPITQNFKLINQPVFNNQRRDKLDKSLSSEAVGNLDCFDRVETNSIRDSPNDYLKHPRIQ